jgi:hypothetical protein
MLAAPARPVSNYVRRRGNSAMSTSSPDSWAFHPDFADIIITKDSQVSLRLLETADIALSFARALVAKEYERASAMLTTALKQSCPPETLRKKLEEMIHYSGEEERWPGYVQVVTGADISDMSKWLRKKPEDFGWAYVAIGGIDYNEAVSVMVTDDEGRLAIREIEWGRP